jgi:predicted dehydrogenase
MSSTRELGIGLIGTGFMGRAHAHAFRMVGGVFPLAALPRLEIVADVTEALAGNAAKALGFRRFTTDWQALVADPAVDIVAITSPNALHKPMALAAIAAGKHVYCEKPLATTLADCREMTAAAEARGVVTMVGFNYLKNPMVELARAMIAAGELGTITGYRGIHAEDFMADPAQPFSWRCDPAHAGGALADIGSHAVSMARHLLGEIDEVCANVQTVHKARPDAKDPATMRPIAIDDQADMMVRFARGCCGTITTSWLATGRKMQLDFEVYGTKGSLVFSQERLNELRFYKTGATAGREGFTLLNAGPSSPDYAAFCPASAHQLGFGDLKTIEVKALIEGITEGKRTYPNFADATAIDRVLEAAVVSSRDRRWIRVLDV